MLPGETRELTFEGTLHQKGFTNGTLTKSVIDNGTLVSSRDFAPTIGFRYAQEMTDKSLRRQYKLPPLETMPKLEDKTATARNYANATWTKTDITVSTEADQTPFAPGLKVSDVTVDGRRTARFVSKTPIINYFSVQSARYVEKHRMHNGVDLAVYYDAQHNVNVDRMLSSLSASLDYYQSHFGPYQFSKISVLEFPDYAQLAVSFPGTITYSEGIGFIADLRDPEKIDYVTFVTAHEFAHQWWAHQIIGANKQGATTLSETLAQYSALMVMEKIYGPDSIRRFLKYELKAYLEGRKSDPIGELPLYRVENQPYIHYNKASLVMYLLKDRMGEDAVNRALRALLKKYEFKGAPYPQSTDLIQALRNAAAPEEQGLITDLFEKIMLVDLRAKDPVVKKRSDGKFDVTFKVNARKYYNDEQGKETEAPLNEPIDVGFFLARAG